MELLLCDISSLSNLLVDIFIINCVWEVCGVGVVTSCDGCGGPLCWNIDVVGRASRHLRMVNHLELSCLASCWSLQ